jgi:hypothetical protein
MVFYAFAETILTFFSLVLPPTFKRSINVLYYDPSTRLHRRGGSVGSYLLAVFAASNRNVSIILE